MEDTRRFLFVALKIFRLFHFLLCRIVFDQTLLQTLECPKNCVLNILGKQIFFFRFKSTSKPTPQRFWRLQPKNHWADRAYFVTAEIKIQDYPVNEK